MSTKWSIVRLQDVLSRAHETIAIRQGEHHPQITVRLWGQGAVRRKGDSGAVAAGGRRFVARTGQLILSRIDARNGALAIVPKELDGSAVSNDFPLFDINRSIIDPAYLGWVSRSTSFIGLCRRASEGTTNRVRLQEERFLALEMRVPNLAEQRRIARWIEELVAKLTEVQRLRREVSKEIDLLCRALLGRGSFAPTRMGELLRLRELDTVVQQDSVYDFAGVYSFGRGVFRGPARLGGEFAYQRLTKLRAGDFVYPKLMAWEGAFGVVPPECDGCFVSPEFPVFEIDRTRVLPEVIDVHFRTPSVWPVISGVSSGTNVRRRRLHPEKFLDYEMPVPPRDVQLRLAQVRRHAETMGDLRDTVDGAMSGLLPSVLDRVFRCEL